ncbi:MAG TPA: hypothetical protein VIY47_02560 [Ignavibacteriaceae bacterium]
MSKSNQAKDPYDHPLTPSKEEQILLVLAGKCPHNKGWDYDGHGHNDDYYRCRMCGDIKTW